MGGEALFRGIRSARHSDLIRHSSVVTCHLSLVIGHLSVVGCGFGRAAALDPPAGRRRARRWERPAARVGSGGPVGGSGVEDGGEGGEADSAALGSSGWATDAVAALEPGESAAYGSVAHADPPCDTVDGPVRVVAKPPDTIVEFVV